MSNIKKIVVEGIEGMLALLPDPKFIDYSEDKDGSVKRGSYKVLEEIIPVERVDEKQEISPEYSITEEELKDLGIKFIMNENFIETYKVNEVLYIRMKDSALNKILGIKEI